jgi:hypothetical protein
MSDEHRGRTTLCSTREMVLRPLDALDEAALQNSDHVVANANAPS